MEVAPAAKGPYVGGAKMPSKANPVRTSVQSEGQDARARGALEGSLPQLMLTFQLPAPLVGLRLVGRGIVRQADVVDLEQLDVVLPAPGFDPLERGPAGPSFPALPGHILR